MQIIILVPSMSFVRFKQIAQALFTLATQLSTTAYQNIQQARFITERKRVEEERQQLEHQFHHAQKLESLGVLAGGIAHDFNNILTVVMGHCYMAQNDMIPEQEYKEAFQKIETAGNRAKDLCRQMLSYVGKSPMEQTQVNLWLLVDEVVKMLQMDLIMPVMGGIEAYHELRTINPTVPMIICSGYGVESVEHVIKNDPHAGFVHKPYIPAQLRDMMMRMIADC
jgi:CheY-like chemotaxis protein